MALSRVVSEIFNVELCRDLEIWVRHYSVSEFSHSRVFNAPAEGVPLGIRYLHRGQKKLESWGYQKVEKVLRQV